MDLSMGKKSRRVHKSHDDKALTTTFINPETGRVTTMNGLEGRRVMYQWVVDDAKRTLAEFSSAGKELPEWSRCASDPRCVRCNRHPADVPDVVLAALQNGMHPAEFTREGDGSFNKHDNVFWCIECYIALDMPVGKASVENGRG